GFKGASFLGKLFWTFLLIKMENKMQNRLIALGMLTALLGAGSAYADVGVAAGGGTTGAGLHLSVPILTRLNARVGVNALNYSYSGSTTDMNYDFKLKLQTADLLLDWFPFNGAFRISAGAVYNGNKIEAKAKPNSSGKYTIQGATYDASTAGSINGRVDFRKAVPYFGIGWGNAVAKDKGWGFSTDLGAIFQGSPKTTLTNEGCTMSTAQCSALAASLDAENRDLQDKANGFRTYPVIRFQVTYKF
ncbi:MAG TPA: hypothetical protein VGO51_18005, partial [Burkholderiaceae bacterium]|nr:hypothetical protein [Burkholderiaceae bacterium]